MRALASDLAYLEGWCLLATGDALPCPAPESLLLKFWRTIYAGDTGHGTPADVEEGPRAQALLKSIRMHAPTTVRRRLASWPILTRWRGPKGKFAEPLPGRGAALQRAPKQIRVREQIETIAKLGSS